MPTNKEDHKLKEKYAKKWIFWIILFSIAILLFQIIMNNDGSHVKSYRDHIYKNIDKINKSTPLYPPPLYNFL